MAEFAPRLGFKPHTVVGGSSPRVLHAKTPSARISTQKGSLWGLLVWNHSTPQAGYKIRFGKAAIEQNTPDQQTHLTTTCLLCPSSCSPSKTSAANSGLPAPRRLAMNQVCGGWGVRGMKECVCVALGRCGVTRMDVRENCLATTIKT